MKTITRMMTLEVAVDVEIDVEREDDDDGAGAPAQTGNSMTGRRGAGHLVPAGGRLHSPSAALKALDAAANDAARDYEGELEDE